MAELHGVWQRHAPAGAIVLAGDGASAGVEPKVQATLVHVVGQGRDAGRETGWVGLQVAVCRAVGGCPAIVKLQRGRRTSKGVANYCTMP